MGNKFVDYLNSMNNATSGNENALAESQVTNKYYNHIRVDRKLGKYISDMIKSGQNRCYILTGHAGDGKTSVLFQILKELNMIGDNEKLKITDTVISREKRLLYVKDMSELSEEKQKKMLKDSLEAPLQGMSSILISNTGPLIKTFTNLYCKNNYEIDDVEDKLLKQLDFNSLEPMEIHGNKFSLINIARVENIGFVKDVINKICNDDLWYECRGCKNEDRCPMYFNKKCVSANKERVIDFVETYYRWLDENDRRITIRQMISQISYAFTGNIRCDSIIRYDNNKFNLFNYNFANLFFGYRGINQIDEAKQIKGIELIQELELDTIALNKDYQMFVKGDFSNFKIEIRNIIDYIWTEFSKAIYYKESEIVHKSQKQIEMRKAIRRFTLLFGVFDSDKGLDELYNQIYGKMYSMYKKAIVQKETQRSLRIFTKIIYQALYIKNIGVIPSNNNEPLYLTLRRNDDEYQSVLLLLGKCREGDLSVVQVEKNSNIEDTSSNYKLQLNINGGKETMQLTLPLLEYFNSIIDGEISTEINPSLSHGLAELNAKLLKEFRFQNDSKSMVIIVNTINGVKEIEIEFENNKMYVV